MPQPHRSKPHICLLKLRFGARTSCKTSEFVILPIERSMRSWMKFECTYISICRVTIGTSRKEKVYLLCWELNDICLEKHVLKLKVRIIQGNYFIYNLCNFFLAEFRNYIAGFTVTRGCVVVIFLITYLGINIFVLITYDHHLSFFTGCYQMLPKIVSIFVYWFFT